jgi:outer membrane protein OmpA-like peptidoglycan-associated protein
MVVMLLILTASAIDAQTIFEEQIPVKIQRLRQKDDSVHLVMDFDLKELKISTDRYLVLTPVLIGGQGKELQLPNIVVNGKQRHKAFVREVALNGWEKEIAKAHYTVLELGKETKKVFRYRYNTGYESWMRDARLEVMTDLCGCGGHVQQLGSEKVANRIVMEDAKAYRALANVAYIRPDVEAVKARSESNDVFLDFPVARAEINPGFGNNPRELAKIEAIIRDIRGDANVQVTGVQIVGYASPEGDTGFNNRLSSGRAEALRHYLSSRSGISPQLLRVGHGGEDWEGLARLVQNFYIEPKNEILSIIRYGSPYDRKQRLQSLGGGYVYRRLLNELYPQLRRVVARIDYNARGFNVEEAKQIIKTRPQQLSLNEMFLVANTYPEGSKEFMDVFETAARIFPDDPVANLNAAASALLSSDAARAERYLEKAKKNTPEYFNNLGVLSMIRGNNARAKNLFQRAAEGNLEAAQKNLEELKRKEEADSRLKN